MTDLQREAREAALEFDAREAARDPMAEYDRLACVADFRSGYLAAAGPREQEIERLRAELAKTKLPIWMLREEHEKEVSALRARVAELEAALVGASKLSPLPETNA